MGDLQGRTALVTGGGGGIGRACALVLAREGARVVVADVDGAAADETEHVVRQRGGEALAVRTDVSRAEDVRALVSRTVESYGSLDCAVNNAGVLPSAAPTADADDREWDDVFSVNVKGVWLCMKHELQQMVRQGAGTIVNQSSVVGLVGLRNIPAYVASKHATVGLTRAAALEYADRNIRINAVCPGPIRTAMLDRLIGGSAAVEGALLAGEPIGRFGRPEEVAEAVLWLCSSASSYVVGHALVVDGGWMVG